MEKATCRREALPEAQQVKSLLPGEVNTQNMGKDP